ncbi:cytochrome P450 [Streptomyces sp. NPDC052396]|uniref:cytochrome P450 n=1 Tax=Streptomyces sp. NPDC052396 TaxID=3365689 RepID=UPI0037D9536F
MGGPMNADAIDEYPGLKLERELLAEAVHAWVPTLGICLGAQLLARSQGLPVVAGGPPEIGWAPLTEVDADDPLVGPLAPWALPLLASSLPSRRRLPSGAGGTSSRVRTSYTLARAPGALPVAGHALPLLRDPLRFFASLPRVGDLVQVRAGPYRAVVVCDPELTRQVLLSDRLFDKGGPLYDRIREVAGDGLASCPYREHRRQRRLLQPAFHPARLPGYAQVVLRHVAGVTGRWRDGQVIDAVTETLMISARVTAAALFGDRVSPEVLGRLIEDFVVVVAGIPRRALLPWPVDRLPTPGNRRYERARSRLRTTLHRLIVEGRAGDARGGGLLSLLLTAGIDGQRGLSDGEIGDQLVTFFAAAMETTGSALAWALHLLAGHPEVERRLRAEVASVTGDGPVAPGHLPGLELTGRVITETLRIRPPVWLLTRTTTADTCLGGHPLPAGTTVVFSPHLLHHRADLYPEPERFLPDRWLGTGLQRPNGAYIPFGGGPRKCIGDSFALTEVTLALAAVVSAWRLEPLDGHPARPVASVVLSPRRLPMRVIRATGR